MRPALPFAYATVAGLVLACSDSTGPSDPRDPAPGPAFQVAPAAATLEYGQTMQFTTTYGGRRGTASTGVSVLWQSSDESVAVVHNGLVRAVSGGQARIVASWGGHQSIAMVTVITPWKVHENPPVCLWRAYRPAQRLIMQC